jgi:hypothetical protein
MSMNLTRAVLLGAVVLFGGAGCGHSEEEWQAMLDRQRQIEATCKSPPPAGAAPTPVAQGCTKDVDCKGERICDLGRCVSPR